MKLWIPLADGIRAGKKQQRERERKRDWRRRKLIEGCTQRQPVDTKFLNINSRQGNMRALKFNVFHFHLSRWCAAFDFSTIPSSIWSFFQYSKAPPALGLILWRIYSCNEIHLLCVLDIWADDSFSAGFSTF